MNDIEAILDELERGFAGDPWHGDSLMKILDGVDAAGAARRRLPQAHTIWELVLHITGWKREVAARMRGKPAGEPDAGDWPAAPGVNAADATAWRRTLDEFGAAHRELIAAVRDLDPARLRTPVIDPRNRELGTGMTHAATLHGIAQHDAYHAGQISLLKKA
jgi:uncharacterized damage-inducible protein DinB